MFRNCDTVQRNKIRNTVQVIKAVLQTLKAPVASQNAFNVSVQGILGEVLYQDLGVRKIIINLSNHLIDGQNTMSENTLVAFPGIRGLRKFKFDDLDIVKTSVVFRDEVVYKDSEGAELSTLELEIGEFDNDAIEFNIDENPSQEEFIIKIFGKNPELALQMVSEMKEDVMNLLFIDFKNGEIVKENLEITNPQGVKVSTNNIDRRVKDFKRQLETNAQGLTEESFTSKGLLTDAQQQEDYVKYVKNRYFDEIMNIFFDRFMSKENGEYRKLLTNKIRMNAMYDDSVINGISEVDDVTVLLLETTPIIGTNKYLSNSFNIYSILNKVFKNKFVSSELFSGTDQLEETRRKLESAINSPFLTARENLYLRSVYDRFFNLDIDNSLLSILNKENSTQDELFVTLVRGLISKPNLNYITQEYNKRKQEFESKYAEKKASVQGNVFENAIDQKIKTMIVNGVPAIEGNELISNQNNIKVSRLANNKYAIQNIEPSNNFTEDLRKAFYAFTGIDYPFFNDLYERMIKTDEEGFADDERFLNNIGEVFFYVSDSVKNGKLKENSNVYQTLGVMANLYDEANNIMAKSTKNDVYGNQIALVGVHNPINALNQHVDRIKLAKQADPDLISPLESSMMYPANRDSDLEIVGLHIRDGVKKDNETKKNKEFSEDETFLFNLNSYADTVVESKGLRAMFDYAVFSDKSRNTLVEIKHDKFFKTLSRESLSSQRNTYRKSVKDYYTQSVSRVLQDFDVLLEGLNINILAEGSELVNELNRVNKILKEKNITKSQLHNLAKKWNLENPDNLIVIYKEIHYNSKGLGFAEDLIEYYDTLSSAEKFNTFLNDAFERFRVSLDEAGFRTRITQHSPESLARMETEGVKPARGVEKALDKLADFYGTENIEAVLYKYFLDWNMVSENLLPFTQGNIFQYKTKFKGKDLANKMFDRWIVQTKRNVGIQSTVHPYILGLRNGLDTYTNTAILSDPTEQLLNVLGQVNNSQDAYDGASFTLFSQHIKQQNSLGLMKQGVHSKSLYNSFNYEYGTYEFLKHASFSMGNERIRNDSRTHNLIEKMMSNKLSRDSFKRLADRLETEGKNLVVDFSSNPIYKNDMEINEASQITKLEYTPEELRNMNHYTLWLDLGGEWTTNAIGSKDFNNRSWEELVQVESKYPEIKDQLIERVTLESANKTGQGNINDASTFTSIAEYDGNEMSIDSELNYIKIGNFNSGIQLNAEHNPDGDKLTAPTQVINASIFGSVTSNYALNLYDAIQKLSEKELGEVFTNTLDLPEGVRSSEIETFVADKLRTALATSDVKSLGSRLLERGNVPFDNSQISNKMTSVINSFLTKTGIRFKFSGGQAIVSPPTSEVYVYELDGKTVKSNYESYLHYQSQGREVSTPVQRRLQQEHLIIDGKYDFEHPVLAALFKINILQELYTGKYQNLELGFQNPDTGETSHFYLEKSLRDEFNLLINEEKFDTLKKRIIEESNKIEVTQVNEYYEEGFLEKPLSEMKSDEKKEALLAVYRLYTDDLENRVVEKTIDDEGNVIAVDSEGELVYKSIPAEIALPSYSKSKFQLDDNTYIQDVDKAFFKSQFTNSNRLRMRQLGESISQYLETIGLTESDKISSYDLSWLIKNLSADGSAEDLKFTEKDAHEEFEVVSEKLKEFNTSSDFKSFGFENNEDFLSTKQRMEDLIDNYHTSINDSELFEIFLEIRLDQKTKRVVNKVESVLKNNMMDMNDLTNIIEESKEELSQQLLDSFHLSLQSVVARIPAQSMQSSAGSRITFFINSENNAIMESVESLWRKGQDYDIDKANVIGYTVNKYGVIDGWNSNFDVSDQSTWTNDIQNVEELSVEGILNYIVFNLYNISLAPGNRYLAQMPIDMVGPGKAAEQSPKQDELLRTAAVHNPFTQAVFKTANAIGKDVIGIAAVAEKVFSTLTFSGQQALKNPKFTPYAFSTIDFNGDLFNNISNLNPRLLKETIPGSISELDIIMESILRLTDDTVKEEITKEYESIINSTNTSTSEKIQEFKSLINKLKDKADYMFRTEENADVVLSQILSAATDNAKELILGKINVTILTAPMVSAMVSMGISFVNVSKFMTSKEVEAVIKASKKNIYKDESYVSPENIAKQFISDDQNNLNKDNLKQFIKFYKIGEEYGKIGKLLGINQGLPSNYISMLSYVMTIEDYINNKYFEANGFKDGFEKFNLEQFVKDSFSVSDDEMIRKYFAPYNDVKSAYNILYVLHANRHYLSQIKSLLASVNIEKQLKYSSKLLPELINNYKETLGERKYQASLGEKHLRAFNSLVTDLTIDKFLREQNITFTDIDGSSKNLSNISDREYFMKFAENFILNLKNLKETTTQLSDNIFLRDLILDSRVDIGTGEEFNYYRLIYDLTNTPSDRQRIMTELYTKGLNDLKSVNIGGNNAYYVLSLYNLILSRHGMGKDSFTRLMNEAVAVSTNQALPSHALINKWFDYQAGVSFESLNELKMSYNLDLDSKYLTELLYTRYGLAGQYRAPSKFSPYIAVNSVNVTGPDNSRIVQKNYFIKTTEETTDRDGKVKFQYSYEPIYLNSQSKFVPVTLDLSASNRGISLKEKLELNNSFVVSDDMLTKLMEKQILKDC